MATIKRIYRKVTLITISLIVSCSVSDTRTSLAKSKLEIMINTQSNGAIKLDGFEKTDAKEMDYMGMKVYILDFKANVSVQSEIWKVEDSWLKDFKVSGHPSNSMQALMMLYPKKYNKGTSVALVGKASLEKKESGWSVSNIQITNTLIQAVNSSESGNQNSSNSKQNDNQVDCNTKFKFIGVITNFYQSQPVGNIFQIKDENGKEFNILYSISEISGEKIILKDETTYGAGDALFNAKLLEKKFTFCCNEVGGMYEGLYHLIAIR